MKKQKEMLVGYLMFGDRFMNAIDTTVEIEPLPDEDEFMDGIAEKVLNRLVHGVEECNNDGDTSFEITEKFYQYDEVKEMENDNDGDTLLDKMMDVYNEINEYTPNRIPKIKRKVKTKEKHTHITKDVKEPEKKQNNKFDPISKYGELALFNDYTLFKKDDIENQEIYMFQTLKDTIIVSKFAGNLDIRAMLKEEFTNKAEVVCDTVISIPREFDLGSVGEFVELLRFNGRVEDAEQVYVYKDETIVNIPSTIDIKLYCMENCKPYIKPYKVYFSLEEGDNKYKAYVKDGNRFVELRITDMGEYVFGNDYKGDIRNLKEHFIVKQIHVF